MHSQSIPSLLLVLNLSLFTASITGDEQVCNRNEKLCGRNCYNPAIQDCFNIYPGVVCSKGQSVCNEWQCYSPDAHNCITREREDGDDSENDKNVKKQEVLCEKGEQLCGWQCYKPKTHTCQDTLDGRRIPCALDQEICSDVCYDPTRQTCFDDGNNDKLCDKDEQLCGFQCYKPTSGKVCTESGAVCRPGEQGCGADKCYSSKQGEKCHKFKGLWRDSITIVCRRGQELCNNICYDPTTEICFKTEMSTNPCPKGSQPCGYSCYTPTNETCHDHDGRERYAPTVCPISLSACGVNCHDPALQVCIEQDGFRSICPVGGELCGSECFNPKEKKCVKDQWICDRTDHVCGNTCYKRGPGLTCYNDKVLCEGGMRGCSYWCYDPLSQSCLPIKDGFEG